METNSTIQRCFDRCGIPHKLINGIVTGHLGQFKFSFQNYYFVVKGKVPLAVADELYNENFKYDIRSDGDCACRHPSTWAIAYIGERIVIQPKETAKIHEAIVEGSEIMKDFASNPAYLLCENEEEYKTYPRFINSYHIDTELGLYVFVQTLHKHKLV